MNKKSIIGGLLLVIVILFSSCTDQLEEKYYNPEKSTQANIPGFFTAILNNDRVRPSYWNVRTFLLMQPAVYSQTAYFTNNTSAYQQADGYTEQYWNDFYTPLSTFRAMETAYNKLSDADKASQEIFLNAARVILYDQASQMVDLWGDIPFSEAGSLETTSTITNAKFDDQKSLYTTFIAGLKDAATYFGTASKTSNFSKYDILLSGEVSKWQRYANSIRLRLLMRISNQDENTAKTAVLEMLNSSSTYPLVDGSNNPNYSPKSSDILLQPLSTYSDNLNNALTELPSHYAPDYMLNTVMNPVNDPRMDVMFDKYGTVVDKVFVPNKEYKAMPIDATASFAEKNYTYYAILDSATFLQNKLLPGIVITAPEVNFLKAEAYQRWGNTVDAKTAYETAVKQSVTFYYYLNGLNTSGLPIVTKPSDSEIDDFVTSRVSYSGTSQEKLAKIWVQKWLHFGWMQSTQAWAEYRRTNYPQLTFPSTGKLSGYDVPPTRLVYPSGEKSNNSENYSAVQSKDTRTTKIFWDVN